MTTPVASGCACHLGSAAGCPIHTQSDFDAQRAPAYPCGWDLILAERRRQIEVEGWSIEHDRKHGTFRLTSAAHAYETENPERWPFEGASYKPKGVLRNLIRAGALYQAAADVDGNCVSARLGRIRCAEKIDALIAEVRAVLG